MSFKKVRDIDEKGRIIDEFLKNRKILRERLLREKLGKQEFARAVEKIQRPVTTAVEKAQKQTDEKQDKVIKQLKENQSELADTVSNLAQARLPDEDLEPRAGAPSPFTDGEVAILTFLGIDPLDKLSADEAQRINRQLLKSLARKRRDDTKERAREDLDAFEKYMGAHGIERTGTSLRTNVMKMSPYSTFGELTIDPDALVGGRLVAYNGRKKKGHEPQSG